jgi:hypothetical protein
LMWGEVLVIIGRNPVTGDYSGTERPMRSEA